MEKNIELTCINCPMGCPLTVTMENGKVTRVCGNNCKRGEIYAHREVTNPTRIVTSSINIEGGKSPRVSVKTREGIPKDKIFSCIKALKNVTIKAPIHIGDVIISNVADTGVDIIATRNCPEI